MVTPGYAPLCHRCSCVWHGVECECGCETSCLRVGGLVSAECSVRERLEVAESLRRGMKQASEGNVRRRDDLFDDEPAERPDAKRLQIAGRVDDESRIIRGTE